MGWTGCARVLLFVFNFIFWLSGGGIMGLGIFLLVSADVAFYMEVIHIESALPLFDYSAYILIAFGGVVFVVGFCGCCGALRKSQCLLGFYIMFLVLVMGGEMAAGVITIIYKDEIKVGLKSRLMANVKTRFGNSNYPLYTKSWEFVQIEMRCCGVDSPGDFEDSLWRNKSEPGDRVPKTCCVLKTKDPKQPVPVDNDKCQMQAYLENPDTSVLHDQGCFMRLAMWFGKHTVIIIGVGFGIAGLEIFGLIFAICMCREARKDSATY